MLTKRLSVGTVIIGAFVHGVCLRIFYPCPSNSIIFLGLCSPCDNRLCIEYLMGFAIISYTERALTLTICDCILRFWSKKVLFYVNFTFVDINTELRHNDPTSQRSINVQERVKQLKLGQSTFCRPGGVPIKNCEIAIFLHFHVYIWRLLTFCVVFSFCGNLTKPCHCVRIAQFVSQQSVPSIIDKRHKF